MSIYLKAAKEISIEAGNILLKYRKKISKISEKNYPGDLVTEADIASEKKILSRLTKFFPDHAILSEEAGLHEISDAEYMWVIDPLDGTVNYAHKHPQFCVSIGLLKEGKPILGVIYNPTRNELFEAVKGKGARMNGKRIHVSKIKTLNQSLLATGFAYDRRESKDTNYPEFCHLTHLTHGVRREGSAALDLAHVAAGYLDGYWERGLKPWDIVAGILLVEEAGGKVSGYDNKPYDLKSGRILATNGHLHNALSNELRKHHNFI